MISRADCVLRYGEIDFAKRVWADEQAWMETVHIDPTIFPNWFVANTKSPVRRIYCNRDMLKPLSKALKTVESQGMANLLLSFEGCFNIRMVRGSTTHFSAHSYGLAIDLNAADNKLGSTSGGFYKQPQLVKAFTDEGFRFGGTFKTRPDPMHFSLAGF